MQTQQTTERIVIVGGGFGGLEVAKRLQRAKAAITLIDRRNFHLFQPLLYQVATGALSPANIAAPLRAILKKNKNVQVILGEVTDIDAANRRVILTDGEEIPYDTLVLAAGVRPHYFGHESWEAHAPGLKTIEDATRIRARVLYAFEAAERESDAAERAKWLTFVVVGGGPTGVEMAGAIAEIARHTLKGNFRTIDPATARVLLAEGGERILPSYPPELSATAARALEKLGATPRVGTMVTEVTASAVTLKTGAGVEMIPTRNVIWSTGIKATPLADALQRATGVERDPAGRVIVQPDLTIAKYPNIFVIGDMAHCKGKEGKPLPGLCPVAQQQGRYVAGVIAARAAGTSEAKPFHYFDKGTMATIGRAAAVVDLRVIHFTGFLGWLVWLFVHLMTLVRFQNRILVFMQWGWSYLTRNRAARLITGDVGLSPESAGVRHEG